METTTMLSLTNEEARVLAESLWQSVQRGDVPVEDREVMHSVRERLIRIRSTHRPQLEE